MTWTWKADRGIEIDGFGKLPNRAALDAERRPLAKSMLYTPVQSRRAWRGVRSSMLDAEMRCVGSILPKSRGRNKR
jgi:hypothetical protein